MSINDQRRQLILRELISQKSCSRRKLIRRFNLRPATVINIVDDLKRQRLVVEEDGGSIHSGRRSPMLRIASKTAAFIGIELHFDCTYAILIDLEGRELDRIETRGKQRSSRENSLQEIRTVVKGLLERSKTGSHVTGLGFADPGIVDVVHGVALRAVNMPEWRGFAVKDWLEQEFKLPATACPAPLARGWSEYREYTPEPPESLFLIELGLGVGGSFIEAGRPYLGTTFRGMEIGHLMVVPDGPKCQCGNRGCLEAVVNSVPDTTDVKNIRIISSGIATALASVVTLLNPSAIILAGPLSRIGTPLLANVRRELTMQCLPGALFDLTVSISGQDNYSAARGAALLARDRFLGISPLP